MTAVDLSYSNWQTCIYEAHFIFCMLFYYYIFVQNSVNNSSDKKSI